MRGSTSLHERVRGALDELFRRVSTLLIHVSPVPVRNMYSRL